MTCCALAALLLVQLMAPFTWLWKRITGNREPVNAAVGWSPSIVSLNAAETSTDTGALTRKRGTRKRGLLAGWRRGLILAIAGVELLVVAGATAALLAPSTGGRSQNATSVASPDDALREPVWFRDLHENVWCRSFSPSAATAAVAADPAMREDS